MPSPAPPPRDRLEVTQGWHITLPRAADADALAEPSLRRRAPPAGRAPAGARLGAVEVEAGGVRWPDAGPAPARGEGSR